MNILMQTTYYYPHVSGLTIYFQKLAEAYVKLGHEVTIVAAQDKKQLAKRENIKGVEIIRSPVLFRINKGVFLPLIVWDAFQAIRAADVVHFNLPSIEALPLALCARLLGKRIISSYVCDIVLPKFFGYRLFNFLIDLINSLTLLLSNKITSLSQDFANNSRVLKRFKQQVTEIYPLLNLADKAEIVLQLKGLTSKHHPLIGMATRVAGEKGIEYVVAALKSLKKDFPKLALVIAGDKIALGEQKYLRKLTDIIKQSEVRVSMLGKLSAAELLYFYKQISVLVVASINSTEAFGMVQVESMLSGTPVIATNLPGVRVPIQKSKMGEIVNIADRNDLAEKLLKVLRNRRKYLKSASAIRRIFNEEKIINKYLQLYQQ